VKYIKKTALGDIFEYNHYIWYLWHYTHKHADIWMA